MERLRQSLYRTNRNGMPTVRISDRWTARNWRETLDWLRKDKVYSKEFRGRLKDNLTEASALISVPQTAYDVGCAEGTFTKIWLKCLKEMKRSPRHVKLFEPNAKLLRR